VRRFALLLVLIACKEEKAVVTVESSDAAALAVRPVQTTTTSSASDEEEEEVRRPRVPVPGAAKATAARGAMLSHRKRIKERVRALESRVTKLEAQLKVTGPRNDQRDVLADLGRSRGELAEVRSIEKRCERAFDGDEWGEIEATWLLAEDLAAEAEVDAAAENYQRFMTLLADFRSSCEALEPIKGAR
jgi:hypothetical protein